MIYLTTAETSVCERCSQLGSRVAREILPGSFKDSQFRHSGFFLSRLALLREFLSSYEDRNERSNFGANSRIKSRLVHLRCKIDLFEKSFHPSNLILELCVLLYIFTSTCEESQQTQIVTIVKSDIPACYCLLDLPKNLNA